MSWTASSLKLKVFQISFFLIFNLGKFIVIGFLFLYFRMLQDCPQTLFKGGCVLSQLLCYFGQPSELFIGCLILRRCMEFSHWSYPCLYCLYLHQHMQRSIIRDSKCFRYLIHFDNLILRWFFCNLLEKKKSQLFY